MANVSTPRACTVCLSHICFNVFVLIDDMSCIVHDGDDNCRYGPRRAEAFSVPCFHTI